MKLLDSEFGRLHLTYKWALPKNLFNLNLKLKQVAIQTMGLRLIQGETHIAFDHIPIGLCFMFHNTEEVINTAPMCFLSWNSSTVTIPAFGINGRCVGSNFIDAIKITAEWFCRDILWLLFVNCLNNKDAYYYCCSVFPKRVYTTKVVPGED